MFVCSCRLLGFANNFAYVIMLSAAHDILTSPSQNTTEVCFGVLVASLVSSTTPHFVLTIYRDDANEQC